MKIVWHHFLAAAFVFTIAFTITSLLQKIEILEPIADNVLDWDFTDFAYVMREEDNTIDSTIVIVDIGQLNRNGIAQLLNRVNKYQPKVVGVNVFFSDSRSNELDSLLQTEFSNTKNLVLVSYGEYQSHIKFIGENAINGFSKINQEKDGVIRSFDSGVEFDDQEQMAFGAEIIRRYDSIAFNKFISRQKNREVINYSKRKNNFIIIDHNAPMERFEYVKNRIVLVGYMGKDMDDLYFTPLKRQFLGKTIPDSHGTLIHANIVSMISTGNYIESNLLINSITTLFICLLFSLLFFFIYNKFNTDFGLIARIMSIALISILTLISAFLYNQFDYKFSISLLVLYLVFAPDSYEYYIKKYKVRFTYLTPKVQKLYLYTFLVLISICILIDLFALGQMSIYSTVFILIISCFFIFYLILGIHLAISVKSN